MLAILESDVNWRRRCRVDGLTGGTAQRGSWGGMLVGCILEVVRGERAQVSRELTARPYFVPGIANEWLAIVIDLHGRKRGIGVYVSALTGYLLATRDGWCV